MNEWTSYFLLPTPYYYYYYYYKNLMKFLAVFWKTAEDGLNRIETQGRLGLPGLADGVLRR